MEMVGKGRVGKGDVTLRRHVVEHRNRSGWNAGPTEDDDDDDLVRFASAASANSVVQQPMMTLGIQFLCSGGPEVGGSLSIPYFGDVGGLSSFPSAAAMLAAARDPNSIHCSTRSSMPLSRALALDSNVRQTCGPQKGSSSRAFLRACCQKSRSGGEVEWWGWGSGWLLRAEESLQATRMRRMVGSATRAWVTMQPGKLLAMAWAGVVVGPPGDSPGQPRVKHQSSSSMTKHCSHEKAPLASPLKTSSRSKM